VAAQASEAEAIDFQAFLVSVGTGPNLSGNATNRALTPSNGLRATAWKSRRYGTMIHAMRRGYQTVSLLIGLAGISLSAVAQVVPVETPKDLVTDTTVCQLRSSPAGFDHKQIRVNAYLSLGFEEASMHDPSCLEDSSTNGQSSNRDERDIWVEFANRAEHEGVKDFLPLVEDAKLRQFNDVFNQRDGQMPRAVLVGTFYQAKPPEDSKRREISFGYGHMGCCHLFVVSRVESVETQYSADLDYSPYWRTSEPRWCYSHETYGIPTDADIRSWQQAANSGADLWRLDPMKVAEEQLKALRFGRFKDTGWLDSEAGIPEDPEGARYFLAPPDDRPTETLVEASSQSFRKTYEFIASDRKSRLIIVVARPYWLEELADSAPKVIWAPVASARVSCFAPGEEPKPRTEEIETQPDAPSPPVIIRHL
jgi:hypothetical protein